MTISSTTVKNSYSGNGTLDTFNYTFKIFADTDLQVIIRDATATETVKTLTTHYTVTGAGSASGGTIVFTSGNIPAATETVVIRRAVPQTQAIDYIANDPFPAESHEEGLDRAMMAVQQLQEEVTRSIKLSRTNTMNSTEFAIGSTERAGKIFGFDDNGELVVSQELGTFKGNWSAGTTYNARDIVKDTSTGNIFLANTGHTSSGSQPLTTNTDAAKWDLLVDASSATEAKDDAEKLAINPEDSQFTLSDGTTTGYSALHHKEKALDAQTAAETAKTAAETAKTAAETAKTAAETAETNATTQATNAATSATSASTSATTATTQATAAGTSATNAASSASAAATSATNAATSETNAGTSATNAASSASAASTSETNAATSATSAASSATTATTQATAAASSATAAQTAQAAAEAAADNFDDTYLGAKASDPTVDNDGDALSQGDLYFNTTSNVLKVYNGSSWQVAAVDATSLASNGFAIAMAIAL